MTAVIEPVEMTIYTISGGFENLNHRKLFFLDSPFKINTKAVYTPHRKKMKKRVLGQSGLAAEP